MCLPFWDLRLLSCCSEAISIPLSVLNPEVLVPCGLPRELASFSRVLQPPAAGSSNIRVRQERLLRGLQNDIHHVADSLPGPGEAPASNLTAAATEANEEELGKWQLQAEEEPDDIPLMGTSGQGAEDLPPAPTWGRSAQQVGVNVCASCRVSRPVLGAGAAFQPRLERL